MGPRPVGSEASRALAERLRELLPEGRFQTVPGGLRNVIGTVPGRERGYVVLGAHYDTKDLPGFVGANDGAAGTALVTEIARQLKRPRHTIQFILFDGEESPRGTPDSEFESEGLRGSRVAARAFRNARAMVLLDFVGDRRCGSPGRATPGPASAPPAPLRRARGHTADLPAGDAGRGARRPPPLPARGRARHRPDRLRLSLLPPPLRQPVGGLPRSVDAVGETIYELMRTL